MDCSTVRGFYIERARMCKSMKNCIECPLVKKFATKAEKEELKEGFCNFACEDLIVEHEEEVIGIVQYWSNENPNVVMKTCPICYELPSIHQDGYDDWGWEHNCNKGVKLFSNYNNESIEDAIKDWNNYCDLLSSKFLDIYDNGQAKGYTRYQETKDSSGIKKCSICGGIPGFGSNNSGHYFHHTCKGVHRKREGINGSFYKTYLDAVEAWNKLQEAKK